ncbi:MULTISPECIES: hypothetical protein [unclassified Caulobacter]|jgi:hypothetical protein|uniref:hypothetical protein n=1 Tax=unclassified Caulobacter TaxID=2648921 RepID=UPI0006F2817F|nr:MULTISPECIES: hypothetical protein [unclassified Caulobacter]KQV54671.1 hypothetical protein ASC62_23055 [Caulobacter sp. Root342]KQV64040.1 hypothetical protein ASC70_19615 [Caulobacter sp. Root343]
MSTQRAGQRASPHAPTAERILTRTTVKLRRVRQYGGADHDRTLMFTFEGGTRRAQRSRCSFIDKERVPAFEGEEAWFEVEEVSAKPWPFWRAVRQVAGPGDA